MDDKRLFLLNDEKIPTALRKLAVPAMVGMMVSAVYNFVDKIFIAQIGTSQFAAGTIVFPIFMIIAALGMMFGAGAGSYISRLLGNHADEQASRATITALFSSLVVGIVITIFGLIFLEKIVYAFGALDELIEPSTAYAKYIIIGSVFTMMNMTMNSTLRAEGSVHMAMVSLITGAVLNIILDPIFIFVLNWGIAGAAIATVLSQMVSTSLLFNYYTSHKSIIRLKLKWITLNRTIYSEIMKIGIPTFIQQGLASLTLTLINHQAKAFGENAIAAMGAVITIYSLSFFVVYGFSHGFQPLAGYNYGAKHYHRLNKAIKVSILWTSIYSVLMTLVFFVFARQVIGLFSKDPEVLIIGIKALRAFGIFLPFLGTIVILVVLFQALGHAKEATILSLSRQGFFLVPAILILPRFFGINGVIAAQPLADGLMCVLTFIMAVPLIRRLLKEEHLKYGAKIGL
jgi:putative MATE family efflux protein